jgi:hypothetical protein
MMNGYQSWSEIGRQVSEKSARLESGGLWGCSSSDHSFVGMSLRYAQLAPDQRREAVARLAGDR